MLNTFLAILLIFIIIILITVLELRFNRYTVSAIGALFYLAMTYPIVAAIIGIVTMIYVLLCRIRRQNESYSTKFNPDVINERKKALKEAEIYLAPYNSIWNDLKLVNRHCKLTLGSNGVTIEGIEKKVPYRHFRVIASKIHTNEELWNLFCKYYAFNTTYDGLVEHCIKFGAIITESISDNELSADTSKVTNSYEKSAMKEEVSVKPKEKIDVNNCSEAELTELPGISIVLAKKIINKREEIKGFKNIDEFFMFMKFKSHIENQLRELVKTEKMCGSVKNNLNSERTIDL